MTNQAISVLESADQKPFMSLEEARGLRARRQLQALYVLNCSDLDGQRMMGEIVGEYRSAGQDPQAYVIPMTFIPVNLADVVSDIGALLNSPSFARLVNSRAVKLVRQDVAAQLFDSNLAWQEERARLAMPINMQQQMDANNAPRSTIDMTKVQGVVVRIMNENMNDNTRLARLQAMQSQLNLDDFRYILANSTVEGIKKFAQQNLSLREGNMPGAPHMAIPQQPQQPMQSFSPNGPAINVPHAGPGDANRRGG